MEDQLIPLLSYVAKFTRMRDLGNTNFRMILNGRIENEDGLFIQAYGVDRRYVSLIARKYEIIFATISKEMTENKASANDIEKILTSLKDKLAEDGHPCVIVDYCPATRKPRVSFLITYISEVLSESFNLYV